MFDALLSRIPSLPSTAAIGDALRDPKGLFALFAVVALVLYGLSVGRTKALISLLSIYVAYVLTALFPFMPWLTERTPKNFQPVLGIGIFIVLYVVTFLVLSKSLTRTRLRMGEITLWQVALISVVQIGLLASIGASFVPEETGRQYLGVLYPWLGGSRAPWVWAAVSLLIMPFMHNRRRDD